MAKRVIDRMQGYSPGQMVTGVYKGYAANFGFLITDDKHEDIYIGKECRGNAMHNDTVQVEVLERKSQAGKYEGQVVRVVTHANETVVGTFALQKNFAVVTPDDERMGADIYIPADQMKDAKSGAKVLVRITKWPEAKRMAEGVIEEVLGYEGDKGLDISLIIASHHIPKTFPDEVLAEAEQVAKIPITPGDRMDFRDQPIITIDGADAKDFDDAVYCRTLDNGNTELGVHIADVSWYAKRGSELDKEAFRRGTSVYLADRVIPMLPEVLSNGVCSLNEGVDRYTMSVVMEVNEAGEVVNSKIGPGIIRSARRCTYAEVRKALLEDIYPDNLQPHLTMLKTWQELAERLIRMRTKRGALSFDFPEFKILLDEDGKPIQIVKRDRTIAEKMVEEAMLLANETIARFISKENRTAIFRVHQSPDKEKLQMVLNLLQVWGARVELGAEVEPKDVQKMLAIAEEHGIQPIIETMTLRSLPQAYYDIINWGHFGLASECYTHFTSPIRRYPDLVVHRLIREVLAGKSQPARDKQWLARAAEQSSMAERRSVEAERETNDLKRTEYMAPFVGEVFDATVTGLANFGVFVALDNGAEGLVHTDVIDNGRGYFEERDYTFKDHGGQTIFQLGDQVRVTLAKADIEHRTLDFLLGEFNSLEEVAQASAAIRSHKKGKSKTKAAKKLAKAKRLKNKQGKRGKRGKRRRR